MNYTKKTNRLINAIWQTVKSYTERIDNGEAVDDDFIDQMVTAGATFADQHKDISSASLNPRPDQNDCDVIDVAINAVILNLMHVIGKCAEIDGLTMKESAEPVEMQQTSMIDFQ